MNGYIEYALEATRNCASRVIIAGGALRDHHLGITPKDIDVFVGPDFDATKIHRMFEVEDDSGLFEKDEYGNIEVRENPIASVFAVFSNSYLFEDFPPIQIVVCRRQPELFSLIRSFDIGMCQIGMEMDYLIGTTTNFHRDLASRRIVYCPIDACRGGSSIEKSRDRAHRHARHFFNAGLLGFCIDHCSFDKAEIDAVNQERKGMTPSKHDKMLMDLLS